MDFTLLAAAFSTVMLTPINFIFVFIGITAGIIVGALPGLTATMGCALLIPFTFGLPPIQGLLMLIGIFCGGIYGGSISGILIRTPGTPAAAATLLDGYPLAQKGLAGKAIGIGTVASFVGGTTGAIIMTFLSPQIAKIGLKFGPPEFCALAIFGLGMIITISGRSILKGIMAALFGLMITVIGFDPLSGVPRFTFGSQNLLGALTIHGLQPGPMLFKDHLDVVYPIFAGMIMAQFILLIVGLSGARVFAKLITVDRKILTPVIFFLCVVGSYAMRFSFFDVGLSLIIGVIAYFMEYYDYPVSPILLALILGPMAEQNLRRSLIISHGDPTVFFTRPISAAFILLAVAVIISSYFIIKKTAQREQRNAFPDLGQD